MLPRFAASLNKWESLVLSRTAENNGVGTDQRESLGVADIDFHIDDGEFRAGIPVGASEDRFGLFFVPSRLT